ncbi:hypothetical protein KP79_PYT24944 [Mizuhopecten yessoensis]|uniref:Uncharacterized protein n=1 Tax=Mizuhopecten yessoensis TaxID=6573 RepID=A0A210Q2P9_MIZYE|nr:hypothetical protein KP79_PYT24944 [Mizuhopecten yessoensis]
MSVMVDKHIDIDVLRRTVRFHVSGARRNSITRFEVVKVLTDGGLPGSEIQAVFRCEAPNTWFTTVTSQDIVDRIVSEGVVDKEHFSLHPECCDRRRLTNRVQWLPSWIADEAIAAHFHAFYGKLINVERETSSVGGVNLETGTRVLTKIIREGDQDTIPHRARLFGKSALIMVPGRPPICLRCQQINHVRGNRKKTYSYGGISTT